MLIVFIGGVYLDEQKDYYKNNSKIGLAYSSHAHQMSIISGLKSNNCDVKLINAPFIGVFPRYFKKIVVKPYKHDDTYNIGYLNIPIIKQVMKAASIFLKLLDISKNENYEMNIIVYMAYTPHLLPAYLFKLLKPDAKLSVIVPDLPEFFNTSSKKKKITAYIKKLEQKVITNLLKRADSCILLTEKMKDKLNLGNKPFIIQEGIINMDDYNEDYLESEYNVTPDKKVILYTGTLQRQYGIVNLLQAFEKIKDRTYYLYICGSGEAEEEIVQMQKNNNNIIYFGQIDRSEVLNLQKEATVLVNPRTNEGEYTQYSFPSKTMEYLASGKPVIAYKLDGIPDEYDNHIYYVEDSEIESLKNKIIEVCRKENRELNLLGKKTREFVLSNKNNIEQTKRILALLKTNKY